MTAAVCGPVNDKLVLVKPAAELEQAYLIMLEAWRASGESNHAGEYGDPAFDFLTHIGKLERYSRGEGLPEGYVAHTTFWLTNGSGAIVGTSRLRHVLNEELMLEGGHIGYDISPLWRRRGYGSALLRLMLAEAKKMGLNRVLVTCDSDNTASRRIIEKNGGILENEVIIEECGLSKPVLRFWIDNEPEA